MYVCVNYDVLYVMIDHTLYLVITVNCLFAENVQQIINELSKKYRFTFLISITIARPFDMAYRTTVNRC